MAGERVLIVSNLWPPAIAGGGEAHAAALADRLRARGHAVGVVTLGVGGSDVIGEVPARPYRPDRFHAQPRLARLAFHAMDVYRPATARVLRRAIDEFRPTVVHSHEVSGLSSTALSVPNREGVGHVHTLHGYWLLCQRRSLTRRDGSRCDVRCRGCRVVSAARRSIVARHPPHVVVAVSRATADVHAGVDWMAGRLRVINNPTDRASRTAVSPDGPVTFGYIGRLTVEKGVRTLLAAFRAAELEGARLSIAGDGPLAHEVEAARDDRVELAGWVDTAAKDRFFAAIDCLIVPSQWLDPAPLVVGEARVRGIPVIGADIGGIPELVSPRSRSLLFPPGDAASLSGRLRSFAADPVAFVDPPSDVDAVMTWDRHLELVEGAYRDARDRAVPRS